MLKSQTLKTLFSPNSSNQNYIFKKIGWYTFFLLYLWAKYELIWLVITAQTATLGANMLVVIAKCFITLINYSQDTHLIIWLKYLTERSEGAKKIVVWPW